MGNQLPKNIHKGTVGELLVQMRLLEYGVQAAPPLKDSGNDLIAIRGEIVKFIQVKTEQRKRNLPKFYHLLVMVDLIKNSSGNFLYYKSKILPSSVPIIILVRKNTVIERITKTGIYLIPALSFPLFIMPRIIEPKVALVTKLMTAKNRTKEDDTFILEKVIGNVVVSGNSIEARFFSNTLTKKVDKPNNIGAPIPIATKMNITYIKTFDLIFSLKNVSCLRFLEV